MKNISALFEDTYLPQLAIVIYKNSFQDDDYYVESYEMDSNGSPVNAHPLSVQEASALAKVLDSAKELQKSFLKPKGLLPDNVLYVDPSEQGCVIWCTPPKQQDLFFIESLGIDCGKANIPALLWKATKTELHLFASKSTGKPDLNAPLYHAPFLNLHESGNVCMGTVEIQVTENTTLEQFIESWQGYFFNSYFSHLIEGHNPIKGSIVQLWQQQVNTGVHFPASVLVKSKLTLKNLIQ